MADIVFREAPPEPVAEAPRVDVPEPKPSKYGGVSSQSDLEPIELFESSGRSIVLESLDIHDSVSNIPEEDRENLQEVKGYVQEIIKAKGLSPTMGAFKKVLNNLKAEMGLDEEADPSAVLDRIGGVIKAWRNISFIKDPEEKKRIFLKLSTLDSSAKMNEEVFKLMSKYEIWV